MPSADSGRSGRPPASPPPEVVTLRPPPTGHCAGCHHGASWASVDPKPGMLAWARPPCQRLGGDRQSPPTDDCADCHHGVSSASVDPKPSMLAWARRTVNDSELTKRDRLALGVDRNVAAPWRASARLPCARRLCSGQLGARRPESATIQPSGAGPSGNRHRSCHRANASRRSLRTKPLPKRRDRGIGLLGRLVCSRICQLTSFSSRWLIYSSTAAAIRPDRESPVSFA